MLYSSKHSKCRDREFSSYQLPTSSNPKPPSKDHILSITYEDSLKSVSPDREASVPKVSSFSKANELSAETNESKVDPNKNRVSIKSPILGSEHHTTPTKKSIYNDRIAQSYDKINMKTSIYRVDLDASDEIIKNVKQHRQLHKEKVDQGSFLSDGSIFKRTRDRVTSFINPASSFKMDISKSDDKINPKDIEIIKPIGSGSFGVVYLR